MLEDDLFDRLDDVMRPLGALPDVGEIFATPTLDVLRYYVRRVRLHWTPVVGRALSAVAVVRQPADLATTATGLRQCLDRVSRAVNARYPPWRRRSGLAIGLTTLIVTPEPIRPDEEPLLAEALARPPRGRAVPLGLFRLNLGQEAMAFALTEGPDGLFREPQALADALCDRFRRFVPLIS